MKKSNLPSVRAKACSDLAGEVGVAPVLADEVQVPQVIQPDPGIRRGDQNLILACNVSRIKIGEKKKII